jgi:hypothetical protein
MARFPQAIGCQLDAVAHGNNVAHIDCTMHETVRMEVLQAFRHRGHHRAHFGFAERPLLRRRVQPIIRVLEDCVKVLFARYLGAAAFEQGKKIGVVQHARPSPERKLRLAVSQALRNQFHKRACF